MPWHVIVYHQKRRPGDPLVLIDRVFLDEDYPDPDERIRAVTAVENDLRQKYPAPDYTVVSGIGPDSETAEFGAFVSWLLRDE